MREVLIYAGLATEKRGLFHCWGNEGLELNNGNVTGSVAIVELEDGTITTAYPHHVKFPSPPETENKFSSAERIAYLESEIAELNTQANES